MRVLLISDIHANPLALQAVLQDAGEVDETWCLGDLVGYGPLPNEALDLLQQIPNLTCVSGNHDQALVSGGGLQNFNPEAQTAITWQKSRLSPQNLSFLKNLPSSATPAPDCFITHASPEDPSWGYILTEEAAERGLANVKERFLIGGHTHYQAFFLQRPGQTAQWCRHVVGEAAPLHGRAVLNPGSVGQPRDRDPRAAYAIFDPINATFTPCRVQYSIRTVIQQIRECGALPLKNADRLEFGQ